MIFIPGKNPELSLTELQAFSSTAQLHQSGVIVAGDIPKPSDAQAFLNRLGGVVEIIEPLFDGPIDESTLYPLLYAHLEKELTAQAKGAFGINTLPQKKPEAMKSLLEMLKKDLRDAGIKANFINNKFQNVHRLNAAESRAENIWILEDEGEKVLAGRSLAYQDVERYAQRDYKKPFRDARVGMLPPKLAQTMINLAVGENTAGRTIYDPFCGSGTILVEALLMGFNVLGSDVEERMVGGAEKNVVWAREAFGMPAELSARLFVRDAREIAKEDVGSEPLAIVGELHLGKPLTRFPGRGLLEVIQRPLLELYLGFFEALAPLLPKQTPLVLAFPFWIRRGKTHIRIADTVCEKIRPLGFEQSAAPLFYARPQQIVGREIIQLAIR
ncbi:hypothetical protein COV82_01815 [Candidatus Peregrinibacteria bacterium CG11_big_fil_rev_8_21_14_0_20_46_8]|nr:MAG: hypothetical protein COV82_01815 [Candidatus Peregrinibacteria bacterium CG11_big_fil_rev_8_21_14_0_20_46_8]